MATDPLAVTIFRGDSYPLMFHVTDKKTKANINLTGCTATLTVDSEKDPEDDSTKLFSVAGSIDGDPADGNLVFVPLPTHTTPTGKYFYDIQLNGPDGSIRTIVKSTWSITMDITKTS